MNQKSFIKISYILCLTFAVFSARAQSLEKLMGMPYTHPELTSLISEFVSDSAEESFLPYLKVFKVNYPKDGIYLEYNSDIALYRVALFDSGHSYMSYKQPLPLGTKWGMTLEEVQEKTNLLEFTKQNDYVRNYITEDYTINFYFTDWRLSHIKITSTVSNLQKKAKEVSAATGVRLLPDGVVKEGNVIDGQGTMMWGNNAALYKGEWSYGLPHGAGQYIDSFGNKYDGEFKLGFFWGNGKFFSKPYQYSYTGKYAMGKKHGKGKIIYSNKTSYDGDWLQDVMHGKGVYFASRNYVYEGEMKNNAFNGKGILETPQGRVKGTFKNGKPHGVCTQESADGLQSIKGRFINGQKNGIFTITSNGETIERLFENDIEISNEKVDPKKIKSNQ